MTNDDIRGALGAYALDAVTDIERRAVERAAESDPSLQAELDELFAAADLLAEDLTDDRPAPAHVWRAIAADIETEATVVPLRTRRPARRWLTAAAGVAAVAVVAVLGIQVFLQRSEISDLRGDPLAAAAEQTAARPDAVTVTLDGATTLDVVLGSDGIGYVLAGELPALAPDQTYQLWAIVGDRVISAGVLGSEPGVSPFQVDGPVAGFALTVEMAGGVVSSDQDPLALGLLSG